MKNLPKFYEFINFSVFPSPVYNAHTEIGPVKRKFYSANPKMPTPKLQLSPRLCATGPFASPSKKKAGRKRDPGHRAAAAAPKTSRFVPAIT